MRGFDTNVLVRYLVRDDPGQAVVVDRLVAETIARDENVFLGKIVLCETVWVLDSGYGYSRKEIAEVMEMLLKTQQFEIEQRDEVWRAVRRFQQGSADFADYLIGESNRAHGCDRTATFDRTLREEEGFEFLHALHAS